MINRPSCNSCVFASQNRITDVTIADFWGIEKVDSSIITENGVSLLLINSEKGKNIFGAIKDNMFFKKVDYNLVASFNHFHNVNPHNNRIKFFTNLKEGKITNENIIHYLKKYAKDSYYVRLKRKLKKILKV